MTAAVIFVGRLSRAYQIVERNKANNSVSSSTNAESKTMNIFS